MDQTTIRMGFPDLDGPEAGARAQGLLDEILQDAELRPHLDLKRTAVARDDREAQDFGVTLIAVLGTPAVIILANALKAWAERTGTSVEANGVIIKNVRGQDAAAIAKALLGAPPSTKADKDVGNDVADGGKEPTPRA